MCRAQSGIECMVCQIRLKWSQQRIIVKHIWHNMCQMWLCAGARFTGLCTKHSGNKWIKSESNCFFFDAWFIIYTRFLIGFEILNFFSTDIITLPWGSIASEVVAWKGLEICIHKSRKKIKLYVFRICWLILFCIVLQFSFTFLKDFYFQCSNQFQWCHVQKV
jgi:hypothetical protein